MSNMVGESFFNRDDNQKPLNKVVMGVYHNSAFSNPPNQTYTYLKQVPVPVCSHFEWE